MSDKKKRNAQAVAAWNRHGGPHQRGTRRPDPEPEEHEDEYKMVIEGFIEIDGEQLEIVVDWDDLFGEDEDDEDNDV